MSVLEMEAAFAKKPRRPAHARTRFARGADRSEQRLMAKLRQRGVGVVVARDAHELTAARNVLTERRACFWMRRDRVLHGLCAGCLR